MLVSTIYGHLLGGIAQIVITYFMLMQVSAEEAQRRMEYLRQQRDKLLALKKQEREKLLQLQKGAEERPRSAKAARKAVADGAEEGPDPKLLAFRKSLAARLKAEVVGQFTFIAQMD